MTASLLTTGPGDAPVRYVFAHGAGAGMESPFMDTFAHLLAGRGIAAIRFEFAYMAARRDGAGRKPPPNAQRLTGEYRQVIEGLANGPPAVIGGKSMGGRVASMIADAAYAEGLIVGLACLGYPFHPPKQPDKLRTGHLLDLRCPALIVQGERDPFGPRAEVEALNLPAAIALHWARDGDHDLGPRGGSGTTRSANLAAAADAVAAFARRVAAAARG